ncbi:MAG TPA: hypothetical protein VG898_02465 [Solirubrobacterales bacterium]|nr:hypothetical protein [Solirubrobacterales bacterium]
MSLVLLCPQEFHLDRERFSTHLVTSGKARQRDFIIQPDQFKRLRTGQAVVIRPTARQAAEIVAVTPPRIGVGEG